MAALPTLARPAPVKPVLLDQFTGSGTLTAHTPTSTGGSSWAIISGTFGSLSGGYLPYSTTNSGKALINVAYLTLSCATSQNIRRSPPTSSMAGDVRSNDLGTDFYYIDYGYNTGAGIASNLGNIMLDPVKQPAANFYLNAMTANAYYEWKILLSGGFSRVYDSSGVLKMAGGGWSKRAIIMLDLQRAGAILRWDFIEVKPVSSRIYKFSIMGDSISDQATSGRDRRR